MKCCKLPYLFFILAGALVGYLAAMGNFSPDKTVGAAIDSVAIEHTNLANIDAKLAAPANLTLPAMGQIQHQHMTNDEFESFVSTKKAEANASNGAAEVSVSGIPKGAPVWGAYYVWTLPRYVQF